MRPVIEVKNVGKKYLISHQGGIGYRTLVETLTHRAKSLISKCKRGSSPSASTIEEFWALKDLSFTVNEGDRLAILGRNGAGKSTLLKLLSRITDPTEGQIKIRGRVSSLLEVGTGFHPELTGRENIFLNGAILGLRSSEIKKKFDEIVAFAEVEKFLDTPVKRYSSGMFTRLGFAVAAHLDPDLLIVDEVLAVGDQQFQSKCLKKLNELGKVGRTVLFVSHDVGNMLSLCNKGLWLSQGEGRFYGPIEECVNQYQKSLKLIPGSWSGCLGDQHIQFSRFALSSPSKNEFFTTEECPFLELDYEVFISDPDLFYGFTIFNSRNQVVARAHTADDRENMQKLVSVGGHKVRYPLPVQLFHEGDYTVRLECVIHNKKAILSDEIALRFSLFAPQKNTRYGHLHDQGGLFLGNHFTEQVIP